MNPCRVWPQPPYYVTQMVARNYLPLAIAATVENADSLDVSAKRSEDGKSLVLQVVNTHDRPVTARLELAGFAPEKAVAHVEELTGDLNAVNTAEMPGNVCPSTKEWPHGAAAGSPRYEFPAMSFTILRFE